MTNRRKIFKWVAVIFSLLAIQTLTYFTLGQKLLKDKLLPDYFASLTHHSDSVFVRDFYISDCYTGNTNTYTSQNLSKDEEWIKSKFKVNYAFFESPEHFNWTDTTEKKYNLIYHTWTARPDWVTLFGLYSMRQTEILQTDNKYLYKREATYHWLLFFWLPSFEWFESTDLNINIHK